MSPIINFTDPVILLTFTVLFVLFLWLARETKKSMIIALVLGAFSIIAAAHAIEFAIISPTSIITRDVLSTCIAYDLMFVALSYFTYLWVDDTESREFNIKSVNNCLDWLFVKKV